MRKIYIILFSIALMCVSCTKNNPYGNPRVIACVQLSSGAGCIDALVDAPVAWYAQSLSSWITVDDTYHKGKGVISLEYASNRSMEGDVRPTRNGKVVIRTYDGACDTLVLHQLGMVPGDPDVIVKDGKPGLITAEFPAQPSFRPVTVTVSAAGEVSFSDPHSDIFSVCGCNVYSLGALRVVTGACDDIEALVEATFWAETGAQWVYALNLDSKPEILEDFGFANCMRMFLGVESSLGRFLYASSNVMDRMGDYAYEEGSTLQFTVQIEEE